jgi:hypothetical protein
MSTAGDLQDLFNGLFGKKLSKKLLGVGGKHAIYPDINNVVVARNYNATTSKRLLYDFLDIYTDDFYGKITPPQNLRACNIGGKDYRVDFGSSGIFDKMPDTIDITKGENIQGFINIIQTLCNKVPINLDVHGIFSGITDDSTIQEKILCKMRLNMMILGINADIPKTPTIDLSYYKFNIPSDATPKDSRIVTWGNGTCGHNDNKLNTNQFNFKITKFDKTGTKDHIYVVSVSSSFGGNTSLLPLPD